MTNPEQTPTRRVWRRRLVVASIVGGGVVVLGAYLYERWTLQAEQFTVSYGTMPDHDFLKFEMPGIERPPVVDLARSKLRPEELVIGFVVSGRARAYRLDAFRDRSRHIVNDVVGDVPVSVVYCDLDDCVRGYVGRPGQGPLAVKVAGLSDGREMILEVGGTRYYQNSGEEFQPASVPSKIPLERIEPILTDWASWKREHPDTDVYEGIR
jgi:hypothetical protein